MGTLSITEGLIGKLYEIPYKDKSVRRNECHWSISFKISCRQRARDRYLSSSVLIGNGITSSLLNEDLGRETEWRKKGRWSDKEVNADGINIR